LHIQFEIQQINVVCDALPMALVVVLFMRLWSSRDRIFAIWTSSPWLVESAGKAGLCPESRLGLVVEEWGFCSSLCREFSQNF